MEKSNEHFRNYTFHFLHSKGLMYFLQMMSVAVLKLKVPNILNLKSQIITIMGGLKSTPRAYRVARIFRPVFYLNIYYIQLRAESPAHFNWMHRIQLKKRLYQRTEGATQLG